MSDWKMATLNLYSITQLLLKEISEEILVTVDEHDHSDPEGSDVVWIVKYPEGGMCAGEYLSLSPAMPNSDEWYVAHNSADVCGGHPTYWSISGKTKTLLPELTKYIVKRSLELK